MKLDYGNILVEWPSTGRFLDQSSVRSDTEIHHGADPNGSNGTRSNPRHLDRYPFVNMTRRPIFGDHQDQHLNDHSHRRSLGKGALYL